MQLRNLSAEVVTTASATFEWVIVNTTCPLNSITFNNPLTGTVTGNTTLTQQVTFPDNCELHVCLYIEESIEGEICTTQTCFNVSGSVVYNNFSWNCVLTTENQQECIFLQSNEGQFTSEETCLTCVEDINCSTCYEALCNDFTIAANYNCGTGLSLVWTGVPYTGLISCVYFTVNTAVAPCTDNIIATNISNGNLASITGLLPPGSYSINVHAQIEGGCVITSNPIVVLCPDTPQVEWNLECCQTTDTAGTTAGYADKYYILDITNNDIAQPLYVDFSFFQVADRLKFYDLLNVTFVDGLPTNLGVLSPIADTSYVGKFLSCYPPAVISNLYQGFVEIVDTTPGTATQSVFAMDVISPPWSLLRPCNDNWQQSTAVYLPCAGCTNINAAYNIPKNCANLTPDCEPVDIIGCGRLTITAPALNSVNANGAGRRKLFVHLESNDCNTGCTAAVFKIICPHCIECEIDCTVEYDCINGIELTNCWNPNLVYQYCELDENNAEICTTFTQGGLPITLPNGQYTIKVINPNVDNCYQTTQINVQCACELPTLRSSGATCYPNGIAGLYTSYSEAISNAYVQLKVNENTAQYNNHKVRYGVGCNQNNCANWVGLNFVSHTAGWDLYQSSSDINMAAMGSIFALYTPTSNSALFTMVNLPDGNYSIGLYYDNTCEIDTPMTVSCVVACTPVGLKAINTSNLSGNPNHQYFISEILSSHTTPTTITLGVDNGGAVGMYNNYWLRLGGSSSTYNSGGIMSQLIHDAVSLIPGYDTYTISLPNLPAALDFIYGIYATSNVSGSPIALESGNYAIKVTEGVCTETELFVIELVDCAGCFADLNNNVGILSSISCNNNGLGLDYGHYEHAVTSDLSGTTTITNDASVTYGNTTIDADVYTPAGSALSISHIIDPLDYLTSELTNVYLPVYIELNNVNSSILTNTLKNIDYNIQTNIWHDANDGLTYYSTFFSFESVSLVCEANNLKLSLQVVLNVPFSTITIQSLQSGNDTLVFGTPVSIVLPTGGEGTAIPCTYLCYNGANSVTMTIEYDIDSTSIAPDRIYTPATLKDTINFNFLLECL